MLVRPPWIKMRKLTLLATSPILLAGLLGSIGMRQKEFGPHERRRIWKGPCWGYEAFARTYRFDVISIERIRELTSKKGLQPCFDSVFSQSSSREDFVIYAKPSEVKGMEKIIFSDQELLAEIVSVPALVPPMHLGQTPELELIPPGWEIALSLPKPYWSWNHMPSSTEVSATIGSDGYQAIQSVLVTDEFKKISYHQSLTRVIVVKRNPLLAWGNISPFDYYFTFDKDCYRFQKMPIGKPQYCGHIQEFEAPMPNDPPSKTSAVLNGRNAKLKHLNPS